MGVSLQTCIYHTECAGLIILWKQMAWRWGVGIDIRSTLHLHKHSELVKFEIQIVVP